MKILYVDLLYDYGVKLRGLNNIGQLGFKASFEMLGHSVETFYYDDYLQRIDELQSEVVRVADAVEDKCPKGWKSEMRPQRSEGPPAYPRSFRSCAVRALMGWTTPMRRARPRWRAILSGCCQIVR